MRIMWSVNTLSPRVAIEFGIESKHAISWVEAMSKELVENRKTDLELAIVSVGTVKKLEIKELDGITYYVMPRNADLYSLWDEVLKSFSPDIIHIYGTEENHNIPVLQKIETLPVVVSLQGIITSYAKYYFAGLSEKEIRRNMTIRDVILRDGIFAGERNFRKKIPNEQKVLKSVKYIEGRSDWDRETALSINPNLKYYYCPRMIREDFFNYFWVKEEVEPFSVLVHQGNYPIKGLHFLLDAIGLLKRRYPNLKLYIAGRNNIQREGLIKKITIPGYSKLLQAKIQKYNLQKNIIFTGYLSADELAQKLSTVNVCVIPSAIENAPNSLAEAMIVGTPCIASYVGGNADMLCNGKFGELYCYNDPVMLAYKISVLFEDMNHATKLSIDSQAFARKHHDPTILREKLLMIYDEILDDFRRKDK